MSSAVRDRSARSRIRAYLTQHGSIEDASGRATAVLKDAVNYKGSAVAFIQLVTAMDQAGEIRRDVRGKRTYKISGTANDGSAALDSARPPSLPATDASGARIDLDYDQLARALLREVSRLVGAADIAGEATPNPPTGPDAIRLERDRLLAERDQYARRLELARLQLSALISGSVPPGAAGLDVQAWLAGGQRVEQAS